MSGRETNHSMRSCKVRPFEAGVLEGPEIGPLETST